MTDTIVGVATAAGEGGVAIVRLSGDEAVCIFEKVFRPRKRVPPFESHRLMLGHVMDGSEIVDEAMGVVMLAFLMNSVLEAYGTNFLFLRHFLREKGVSRCQTGLHRLRGEGHAQGNGAKIYRHGKAGQGKEHGENDLQCFHTGSS